MIFKTVNHKKGILHVETPLGIVNITVGLSDSLGKKVESIELIPNHYVGENKVKRSGYANSRFIKLRKTNK